MQISRRHMAYASAGTLFAAAMGLSSRLAADSGEDTAVTQAVEDYRKGLLSADRSLLEKLCADQLSYGHSSGKLENKTVFVSNATNGKSVWKFITFSDQTNQVTGNNAISRFIFTGENESEGKVNPVKIGVLIVWQKHDKDWKMLARQAYKI